MKAVLLVVLLVAVPPKAPPCPNGKCPLLLPPAAVQPAAAPIPPPPVIAPPILRPADNVFAAEKEPPYFFGVRSDMMEHRDRCIMSGREITSAQCLQMLAGPTAGGLPDDAKKTHLTLIAKDDLGRKSLETLMSSAGLADVRDRYRVQVYDASAAVDAAILSPFRVMSDDRFKASGRVALLQRPSETGQAKVLGAFFQFETADDVIEGVRKNDPEWDLSRIKPVPAPARPQPASDQAGWIWYLVIIVGAGFFIARMFDAGRR